MSRQKSLKIIWGRLLLVLIILLAILVIIFRYADSYMATASLFLCGNLGAYVGFHRSLSDLKDQEIIELSNSWVSMVVPPIIGGILALVLYLIFLSGIVQGDLFPKFELDQGSIPETMEAIFCQHPKEYQDVAKLLFWGFVAGFNEKYVVDLIQSFKSQS